mmetsp:Transcript_5194/g.19010  ORF Transcript_5194/g.19010 Transcript_5194/m.19010 type:complete len:203 (+) Transcript_5194:593-1201(+)
MPGPGIAMLQGGCTSAARVCIVSPERLPSAHDGAEIDATIRWRCFTKGFVTTNMVMCSKSRTHWYPASTHQTTFTPQPWPTRTLSSPNTINALKQCTVAKYGALPRPIQIPSTPYTTQLTSSMQLTLGRIVRMSAITSGSDVKSVECMRSVMGIRSKPPRRKLTFTMDRATRRPSPMLLEVALGTMEAPATNTVSERKEQVK